MKYLFGLSKLLFRYRILRVAAFGGVGVVLQTICFEVIGVYLELTELSTATLIGGEVGILTSFTLNNLFSFHDNVGVKPMGIRLVRYHVVVSGSLFIQWLSVFIAEHSTENLLLIHAAYGLGIIIGFLWNYTGYRFWVWRSDSGALPQ